MNLEKPKNQNYCCTVVKIKDLIPLKGRDKIIHTTILSNKVIVGIDTNINDLGFYIPVESQLSKEFCYNNNLFVDKTYNKDKTKSGYIDVSKRRIRCVKFAGFESNGLFMPLSSISYIDNLNLNDLKENDEFDTILNHEICRKYEVQVKTKEQKVSNKRDNKLKRFDKLEPNQFKFHISTAQLAKNIHNIEPDSIISNTEKRHGTSSIFSNILCKRKLNFIEKILLKLGVKIQTHEYDNIYASRTVVKNNLICDNPNGYYNEDIWKTANDVIKSYLEKGMTIYAEIVGYLKSGAMIQRNYDYGYKKLEKDEVYTEGVHYGIYVYRITQTNQDGIVYEFSAKQVQDWCKLKNLKPVIELYYGKAKDLFGEWKNDKYVTNEEGDNLEIWRKDLLNYLKETYLEKDCPYCKSSKNIPSEGIVLRIEDINLKVYKLKSLKFLEKETLQLDNNEIDIESEN